MPLDQGDLLRHAWLTGLLVSSAGPNRRQLHRTALFSRLLEICPQRLKITFTDASWAFYVSRNLAFSRQITLLTTFGEAWHNRVRFQNENSERQM